VVAHKYKTRSNLNPLVVHDFRLVIAGAIESIDESLSSSTI
jgi:hypothetical protein